MAQESGQNTSLVFRYQASRSSSSSYQQDRPITTSSVPHISTSSSSPTTTLKALHQSTIEIKQPEHEGMFNITLLYIYVYTVGTLCRYSM